MSKVFKTVLALTLLLAVSGCMQMHADIGIDKDGSGEATLFLSASPSVIEALKEMQELSPESAGDMDISMFDEIDKDELNKAGKDHGVKVEKFKKQTEDGRQVLDLALSFKDLKGLSYVLGKVMGDEPGEGFGIFDAGDGNLVFRAADYEFPGEPAAKNDEPAEMPDMTDMDPEKLQRQMEVMGKLMGAISELDVSLKITVPGDVVESSAPTVEGRTSVWAIDSSNMMSQQGDIEPEIVFAGKGLKIKPLQE